MRAFLLRGLPLFFFGLFAIACWQDSPQADLSNPSWSVQMHVHGSFSEGMGSIDSHSFEAERLGVDAIWWSDHDFRISSYQHVDHFGFEGPSEPLDAGESWKVKLKRHAKDEKTITLASGGAAGLEFVKQPVRAGQRSLMLRKRGQGAEFQNRACILAASRQLQRRPLAGGVQLALSIFPEQVSAHARAYVRVLLSEHAPREGLELEQYSLRYYLSDAQEEPHREGATFHIPVPAQAGMWNDLEFDLSADVARGFPFVVARDNALYRIIVGVEARRGERSQAAFDDLSILHDLRGLEMYALQAQVIEEVSQLYPDLVQHQGLEVSYASRHLNEFSLQATLIDYDALGRGLRLDEESGFFHEASFRREVTRRAVQDAHGRGGLVSFNHLFGVGMENSPQGRTREDVVQMMLRNDGFGVDILEVGYRDRAGADLADHLAVWDALSAAGLRLVGTGVSDSHGGPDERWSGRPNNFLSWIYAPDPSKSALLEGLGRGRVYFGDIEVFDGQLDIVSSEGWSMGQEVLFDGSLMELELSVHGAAQDDQLVLIAQGEESRRFSLDRGSTRLTFAQSLAPEDSGFVRLELYTAGGQAKAFSNPIHFVRPAQLSSGRVIGAARGAIDVLGLRSTTLTGIQLSSLELPTQGGLRLGIVLLPGGEEAGMSLELGRFGEPSAVRFSEGLEGRWESANGVLRLWFSGASGVLTLLPSS